MLWGCRGATPSCEWLHFVLNHHYKASVQQVAAGYVAAQHNTRSTSTHIHVLEPSGNNWKKKSSLLSIRSFSSCQNHSDPLQKIQKTPQIIRTQMISMSFKCQYFSLKHSESEQTLPTAWDRTYLHCLCFVVQTQTFITTCCL